MERDVVIALDFPTGKQALEFLDKFNYPVYVKVGMELFYSEGRDIIEAIKSRGHKIFLDLKLHDIPNTVESAMRVLVNLGVDMVNVHAGGGIKMMKAALNGLEVASKEKGISRPKIIAVTQLTSTSEEVMNFELLIDKKLEEVVLRYAENTKSAGLDGIVCSPLESEMIHNHLGEEFITLTPGIRFKDSLADDQVRITTPADAKKLGSTYIVVGRPITRAENPVKVYERCVSEFKKI